MKIFGWLADRGGCGQYRLMQPFHQLTGLGHETLTNTVASIDTMMDGYDLVVGQRISAEGSSRGWQRLSTLPNRPAMVFEIDDDLFNVDPWNVAPHRYYSDPQVRERLLDNMAVSDMITVSTEPLARVIRQLTGHGNIVVLPNMVDAGLLKVRRVEPRPVAPVVLGWGGSPSHAKDWDQVAPTVDKLLARTRGQVVLRLLGTPYPDRVLTGDGIQNLQWTQDLTEHYLRVAQFDIGVAPLANTVFNRSKSDIKVLEYAALGVPAVASDLPPYAQSIDPGITGYLIRREQEWARYLRRLAYDQALRSDVGIAARMWAATRTIQKNAWRWEDAYRKLLGV